MSADSEPLYKTARVNRVGLTIDVDPHDLEQKKWATHYRLNVVEIPVLRVLGFLLLSFAILVHNKLILESFSLQSWLAVTILMLTYAMASWLVLYLFFSRVRAFD